jgi:alkanesulfonate monooxygenase SsuD/methylene tetrahydromethanopterin reductase-like flavin-dependent oxidoreductase (luciferase family)
VPSAQRPLRKLGFLTIGLFDPASPRAGHQTTLEIIELGERLGFDSAWVRHRHLQFGISSPVAVLAAASQRTTRIALGTAVIPLGWENPLRLAEDLATVDILSDGRLNPGISVGPPMHWDDVRPALYPDTAEHEDFSYARVERLLRLVRGEPATTFRGKEGIEEWSDRVEPHSPGLADRLWYGGASLRSAEWAGDHAMNFLTSSVLKVHGGGFTRPDFATLQGEQIRTFRERHPDGRVSQGLVVIPTDSATDDQRRRYEDYAAARMPRTREPHGPAQLLFSPDFVGPSDELADRLHEHAGFQLVDEVAFALPFSFQPPDYVQLLTDTAERLGPALGWSPSQ